MYCEVDNTNDARDGDCPTRSELRSARTGQANDRGGRAEESALKTLAQHLGDAAYEIHSSSFRALITAGQSKMQRSTYGLIVALTLTAIPLAAGSAPAQTDRQADCTAAMDASRAEWRALSRSNFLKAGQRIRTGDGRELAGSQVNYSCILIGRAENACAAGQVEQARSYVKEANELLHARPSVLMLATPAGN
jgi:hypothetical protein